MKLTPDERRARIYQLVEQNTEYCTIKEEYESGKRWFEKATGRLSKRLRNKLWTYPGMGFFLHHYMLNVICQEMKFLDED